MIKLSKEATAVIEEIISKGNDAQVRKKGDGVVVLEVKKTIRYTATPE